MLKRLLWGILGAIIGLILTYPLKFFVCNADPSKCQLMNYAFPVVIALMFFIFVFIMNESQHS